MIIFFFCGLMYVVFVGFGLIVVDLLFDGF